MHLKLKLNHYYQMTVFGESQIVLYTGKCMDGLCFTLQNKNSLLHFTLPLDSENLETIKEIDESL